MRMTAPLEVGICCEDLDALARFYTDVLGCTFVNAVDVPPEKSRQAGINDDGYRVARLQTPYGERIKLVQPARRPDDPGTTREIMARRGAVYITFLIDELEAMMRRLRDAGCELLSGPEKVEVRPGTFLAFTRDPEGNALEFVEYADIRAYRPDLGA